MLLDQIQCARAIGRLEGHEAFVPLQLLGQRYAQRLVVVDDQHLLLAGHPAAPRPPTRPLGPVSTYSLVRMPRTIRDGGQAGAARSPIWCAIARTSGASGSTMLMMMAK